MSVRDPRICCHVSESPLFSVSQTYLACAISARTQRGSPNCKENDATPEGTAKWFNSQKGYGFIQPSDGSKDVFVHISAVERSGIGNLHEGQKLSYELERGNQGKTSAVALKSA
jgi:cold shock protein